MKQVIQMLCAECGVNYLTEYLLNDTLKYCHYHRSKNPNEQSPDVDYTT